MSVSTPTGSSLKASSIRPHRKNRTGCKTCKRRKIRCDEQKPACFNCLKHSVLCDFVEFTSATPATPSTFSTSASPSDVISIQDQRPLPPALSYTQIPSFNMLDLELLHNYTTSTAYTLTDNNILRSVYRISLPKLCFHHPFLMRSILALSALHIAHFTPPRRDQLLEYAIQQHQAATRVASQMLSNVTDTNCVAIYIFSTLAYMFSMASPRDHDDFLLFDGNDVADWIYLLRGTRAIVSLKQSILEVGEFAPMFSAGLRRYFMRSNDTAPHERLSELQNFLSSTVKDKAHLDIYELAIEELRQTFSVVNNSTPQDYEVTDVSIWVFRITDEYLELLKNKENAALTILAHFCVLLKKLECHWWMDGRSTHVLNAIWRLVDEEHKLMLRWPIEEIGWIPPMS